MLHSWESSEESEEKPESHRIQVIHPSVEAGASSSLGGSAGSGLAHSTRDPPGAWGGCRVSKSMPAGNRGSASSGKSRVGEFTSQAPEESGKGRICPGELGPERLNSLRHLHV